MRRLVTTSLILLTTTALPRAAQSQSVFQAEQGLAGTREIGLFASGRILSTEYSTDQGKSAFGGAVTFGTHLKKSLAVQGGLGVNYSRQEYSYYKPPLWTFTPTISLILQRSTAADIQPYGLVGAGYEFVSFTKPRCDCDQSRSMGIGNIGVGVRKMLGSSRAFRAELSSQIAQGGPAFTAMAGISLFTGGNTQGRIRPPGRVRNEPPLIPIPRQSTTVSGNRPAPAPTPPPAPAANPIPSNSVTRAPSGSPLPRGVGSVLLSFDGTQVDFTRPDWRQDAENVIDALVVDLTSDAGQLIKVSIEAHTDNVGSNAANIMLGLDRARAVREYLISQGMTADRIRISSMGEDAPIAPNTTAIGRQQNRRIVIKRDN